MPPRRSSRAASAKPVSKPAPTKAVAAAAAAAPKSTGATKKRAASPERSPSPPPKRSRSAAPKSKSEAVPLAAVNGRRKPVSRTASASKVAEAPKKSRKLSPVGEGADEAKEPNEPKEKEVKEPKEPKEKVVKEPKPPKEHKQVKPYFNPLPAPPSRHRPGLIPFAWGAGNFGQFGMGSNVLGEVPKPKRNVWAEEQIEKNAFGEDHAGIEFVTCGGLHTIFIDEKGTIWTCGVNDDAALGRITKDVPDPNNPGSFLNVDDLTSIPHPLESLVAEGFRAVKAVAGDSICAAISDKGELRAWGSFRVNSGSLGFADGMQHQFTPVSILQLPSKPGDAEKVVNIASGSNHVVVLTTHGNIYTWGAGEESQLGRRVLERRKIHGTVPEKMTLGNKRSRKAVTIGSGSMHSFAVDEDGDVWGWGLNSMGQLGTGWSSQDDNDVLLPQLVQGLSKEELGGDQVVQIEGGTHHTLFLTASGKIYACGRCDAGQLGLPDDHEALKKSANRDFVPEPILVPFPASDDPVKFIAVGTHNNAAITHGGALYAWGQGVQGELGLGDEEEVRTPHVVVRKEGGAWFASSVACGGQHTIGLFRRKEKS